MPTNEELAWFAGLFEGEGWISVSYRHNASRSKRKPYYLMVRMSIKMTDLDTLEKLATEGNIDTPAQWPLENSNEASIAQISNAFSNAVPPKGIFTNQSQGAQWWIQRQALAYILGLDPVIILMTPEITEEKLIELIQLSAEWDEFSLEDLQRITSELIEKSKS